MPDIESVMIKRTDCGKSNSRLPDEETKKNRGAKRIVFRIFLCFFTLIFLAAGGALGVVLTIEYGPSVHARDLFVVSVMETSAAKFLATTFLGQEKVDEILAANFMQETDEKIDMGLINVNPDSAKDNDIIEGTDSQVDPDGDGIDIVEVIGSSYRGKMMIVYDPSRVFVGISGPFGREEPGKIITDIYDSYDNVVAGINGGGWDDRPGHGTGGEPYGIVISQGEVLWGTPMYISWDFAGITEDNKLVVGTMSVQEAVDMGVRDAAKYGRTLIINGERVESLGVGSGLNPRTAIGQRADGAMLLLTIDGRQTNSLGASLTDVQDVMLRFGAVNAYNLDGGSSTTMIYNDEIINNSASLVGLRRMCTAFLVRAQEAE